MEFSIRGFFYKRRVTNALRILKLSKVNRSVSTEHEITNLRLQQARMEYQYPILPTLFPSEGIILFGASPVAIQVVAEYKAIKEKILELEKRVKQEVELAQQENERLSQKRCSALDVLVNLVDWCLHDESLFSEVIQILSVQAMAPAINVNLKRRLVQVLGIYIDKAWQGGTSNLRKSAIRSIPVIGAQNHNPVLTQALQDKNVDVRKEAEETIRKIDASSIVLVLIEAIRNPDPTIRALVASRLGMLSGQQVLFSLRLLLKDADANVRCEAITALAKNNDIQSIPALIEALKDAEMAVRLRSSEALAWMCRVDHGEDAERWHLWWGEHEKFLMDKR